jgi:hypothetical protein
MSGPFTPQDPPAIWRGELRDHGRWNELGGLRVVDAAVRAGRVFENLEDLISAGYNPVTRRPRPEPTPPAGDPPHPPAA